MCASLIRSNKTRENVGSFCNYGLNSHTKFAKCVSRVIYISSSLVASRENGLPVSMATPLSITTIVSESIIV